MFAISAHVSVKAQKKGGLLLHPIGRLNGIPNMGLGSPSEGRITANRRAAEALNGMR